MKSNVRDYFERFDQLLISHSAGLQLYSSTQPPNVESVRKFVFKDLLTVEGEYQKDLADFILWVLSSNDRELLFCKYCDIKFQHHTKKEHAELAKVFVYPESRCQIEKKNPDWGRKCYILWNRHCEKIGRSEDGVSLLASRSENFSSQSGTLASKSEAESFHKRALSSVTEMLLPSMDEVDINALDTLSRINLHKSTNRFHSMESFYAPNIESMKDSATGLSNFASPELRSVITPERRRENEDLSALRIYLSSQPTINLDRVQLPSSIKKSKEDSHGMESQGIDEFKEVEAVTQVIQQQRSPVPAPNSPVPISRSIAINVQPPLSLTPVPILKGDKVQQTSLTPVRFSQDDIQKHPNDVESGPLHKVYIMKVHKELEDIKKQLQAEKQEKDSLSVELKTAKLEITALQDKYVKSANDSRLMDKQTREVLQRYIHLQKSTDAEMTEMRERVESLKEELSQRSAAVTGHLDSKGIDQFGGAAEEMNSEVHGIAFSEEFAAPLSISNDTGELTEIKKVYNTLFTSSRSNIKKLRSSFYELNIQHRQFGTILDLKKEADNKESNHGDSDVNCIDEKFEIHSLRSLYMEAAEAYVSDLALSDIRSQEAKKLYETEMAILKEKFELTSRANNTIQKQAKESSLELERLEQTVGLENHNLRRALDKSDRELRRVQFKMDADINMANVEIQQLKSDAVAYSEQVLMELKQREQDLYDAKAIYETELRVKTQSLQDTISLLRRTLAEQERKFAEQVKEKSAQELITKQALEQTIECLRQSIEEQQKHIREQECMAVSQDSTAIKKVTVQNFVTENKVHNSDTYSKQILEYIVPQADDQPGIATTSEDSNSLFDEYVEPQDRICLSISPETVTDNEEALSKSNDKSTDPLLFIKNSEGDENLNATSVAPSLDLTRIYLRDKDAREEEDLVLNSTSSISVHEEFTNPLFKCSSQRQSMSEFDASRFSRDHAIIVVDKAQRHETDSVFTLDNDSMCSKSVVYGNSVSVTIVDAPDGEDRNDDAQNNNNNATVATSAAASNPKQNRGSKPKEHYTKALLKSRALSNSNINFRTSRDSQEPSKDKEFMRSSEISYDNTEDDDSRKDVKRLRRRSSSIPSSPVLLSPHSHVIALPADSEHNFFDEIEPKNNRGIDIRFDEAIQMYTDDEELFGRPNMNVNAHQGAGETGENGGEEEERKPEMEIFNDENPIFARSHSASFQPLDNTFPSDNILPISSLASISKPHSDGVSSITGPEDSRSLSNSIDNGELLPEMLTTHSRSVLQLSKVLGLSTTNVFEGGE